MQKKAFVTLQFFLGILSLILVYSCQNNPSSEEQEIYEFLEICYEDYYKNYDIELTHELEKFEEHLIREGHLSDNSGKSYKVLLSGLDRTTHYQGDLTFDSFNDILLAKNPSDVANCVSNVFQIDSITISKTHFSEISRKILAKVEESEEVSIHIFFKIYSKELSPEELEMPYIKPSIQLFLYRWYYQSVLANEKIGRSNTEIPQ